MTYDRTTRWILVPLTAAALLCGCSAEGDGASALSSGDDGRDEGGGNASDGSGVGTSGGGDEGGDGGAPDEGGTGGGADDDDGVAESTGTTGEPVCDDQTPVELFISPDDSNSMSSPAQVSAAVLGNSTNLYNVPIRTWEFMNYYGFDYPAADPGGLLVVPSLRRDAETPEGGYVLQIGISSEAVAEADRRPINITLVLDTSGSMDGHPIEMLKATSRAIAASLREGDVISMVTWDTQNETILSGLAVQGPSDADLMAAIDGVFAGGGTDLHGGLVAGYALAEEHKQDDRINRIVLISDGGANAGITDIDLIAAMSGSENEEGIYMVGVGVGTAASYRDKLMDDVTDAGKGASVFIDDEDEAQRVFGSQFINTLAVAARDVQVKLDLPPGFEIVSFSGEEYSADPAEIEPQHLAPNDAMVFYQRIATCAPEAFTEASEITVTATYRDAVSFEGGEVSVTARFDELLAADASQLLKGAAVYEYAQALKAWKRSEQDALARAQAALAEAQAALPGDGDLAQIGQVLGALAGDER